MKQARTALPPSLLAMLVAATAADEVAGQASIDLTAADLVFIRGHAGLMRPAPAYYPQPYEPLLVEHGLFTALSAYDDFQNGPLQVARGSAIYFQGALPAPASGYLTEPMLDVVAHISKQSSVYAEKALAFAVVGTELRTGGFEYRVVRKDVQPFESPFWPNGTLFPIRIDYRSEIGLDAPVTNTVGEAEILVHSGSGTSQVPGNQRFAHFLHVKASNGTYVCIKKEGLHAATADPTQGASTAAPSGTLSATVSLGRASTVDPSAVVLPHSTFRVWMFAVAQAHTAIANPTYPLTSECHTVLDPYVYIDPTCPLAAAAEVQVRDIPSDEWRRVERAPLIPVQEQIHIVGPGAIVAECDPAHSHPGGATVHFALDIQGNALPPTAVLTVRDPTRVLLTGPAGLGPVGIGPHQFPLGSTVVHAEIRDNGAWLADTAVTVQVKDTQPPNLQGAADRVFDCQGPSHTILLSPGLLGISAVDDCDPSPAIELAPQSVYTTNGQTLVYVTGRDAAGNTVTATINVTARDSVPPVFTAFPDSLIEVTEQDRHRGFGRVAWAVAAQDNCALPGEILITCFDLTARVPVTPSQTSWSVGEHLIECTARDPAGNRTVRSFTIRVLPLGAPPVVSAEDVIVGTEPGECFAFVPFAVTVNDPNARVVFTAAGGVVRSMDAFPVGETVVTVTATNAVGPTTTTFRIVVVDREPPTIFAPNTATLVTTCSGAKLSLTAGLLGVSVGDNCDQHPSLTFQPTVLDPSTLPVRVLVTAQDGAGNRSTHGMDVVVLRGPLDCRTLRPLDGHVDNRIQPGRTIPLKLRITCDNVFVPDATATVESVTRVAGETPVANEVVNDAGTSNGDTGAMRVDLVNEHYLFNLATAGWAPEQGTRFEVVVRVRKERHVDTLCRLHLVNH